MPNEWLIAIDTGGTFTDCLARRPDGAWVEVKVLSSAALRGRVRVRGGQLWFEEGLALAAGMLEGFRLVHGGGQALVKASSADGAVSLDSGAPAPRDGEIVDAVAPFPAPLLAARIVTGTPPTRPLPPLRMRLGTTRGTNALLERRLDPVLLVTHEGLGDALTIGDQRREHLFDPAPARPPPLQSAVLEVRGRQGADGAVIELLDEASLRAAAATSPCRHAAIVFLHAWRDGGLEASAAESLRAAGFARVVTSHEVSGAEGFLPRGAATLVDAALSTQVGGFLDAVARGLTCDSTLEVMTSAGGLQDGRRFRPKDSLLSGPAGGARAVLALAERHGLAQALGFDMGGTSTDACRVASGVPLRDETSIGSLRLASTSVAVESVAAGGGSICWLDAGALRVGPRSAAGEPGPACYGRGGPLTLTDVNLLLGRADPARFAVPIDLDHSRRAFDALVEEVARFRGATLDERAREELLEGILAVADATTAEALKATSAREGYDPAKHVLVAFGGAGGQHACRLAERLGINTVLHPDRAGLLSAAGAATAAREAIREESASDLLTDAALVAAFRKAASHIDPFERGAGVRRASADVRWKGQSSAVTVEIDSAIAETALAGRLEGAAAEIRAAAAARYRALFGAAPPDRPVELARVRLVMGSLPGEAPQRRVLPLRATHSPGEAPRSVRMRIRGAWREVPALDRSRLIEFSRIRGPALVADEHSTLVVDHGWSGAVLDDGSIQLDRDAAAQSGAAGASAGVAGAPPARHAQEAESELCAARLASVAVQMGAQLRRTAVSVNVRERLDYSCGILDPDGRLVTTAPHIPVHLGALGPCVQALSRGHAWKAGDLLVTNHPAFGGSHLPDITVVAPVHERAEGGELLGFVAARAHHAEVGGTRPGSMPPDATSLDQEGVVIPPTVIGRAGSFDPSPFEALMRSGPFPSRAVEDNVADLAAMVASLRRGAEGLRDICADLGVVRLREHMHALRARAAARVRGAIEALCPAGMTPRRSLQRLDDGWPISVAIERRGDRLRIDLTGSGPVHPRNLNAPCAVTRSAVMYAMRLLVESHRPADDRSVPLNDGLLDPVDLVVPEGFLNPRFEGAKLLPVAAGNTETSQRLVDALLLALGVAACSQGTMNNLLLGDDHWTFYETIAGGQGATSSADGASGMHAHMTNTRITDPEILEARIPVRVRRFGFRSGSGGVGAHHGGDGLIRELEFLAHASVSFISQHRSSGADGLDGGSAGMPGAQRIHRADGGVEVLPGIFATDAAAGDRLVIETPGGGGCGAAGAPAATARPAIADPNAPPHSRHQLGEH